MKPARLSEPLLLAADTALGACSVALLAGRTILAHRLAPMERGHAEALAPMVQAVMDEAGIGFGALDRLAVTTGPGTFTGQRVGLAFMRGLRLALHRPLNGVTTLAAMAEAARQETGLTAAAVLHDCRRGEVYAGGLGLGPALTVPQILSLADAVRLLLEVSGPIALAGTAAPQALEQLRAAGRDAVLSTINAPDALFVARLALAEPPAAEAPQPLYLRPPDAKLPNATRPGAAA